MATRKKAPRKGSPKRRPAPPGKGRAKRRGVVVVPETLQRRVVLAAAATGKPRAEIGKTALAAWILAARLDPSEGVEAFLRGFDRMYGRAMRNLAGDEIP